MIPVFRDRWLLVVDKPFGVPTQGTRAGEEGLYEVLKRQEPYVGLHHRLDRVASGLVLFTLDPAVNAAIADGFRSHRIEREYLAVLAGHAESGAWERPVDGKRARTRVDVVGRGEGLTAVRCRLETGRKHQVRVHAALAGTPVVGDRRYGGEAGHRWPRLALHARRITLDHPITGERLLVEAPIPGDLVRLWEAAGGG